MHAGDVIGDRYRVQGAIGHGGMGTVWLCRDEILHREVAVKQVGLLPGESVTDSARALREARSSAALSHRNVVTVFDVIEQGREIWLIMEHVPSRSLSELIHDKGRIDPARVAAIGAQVADGLAAAHALGTTHRDVKPGNVLVRDDGVAKITDFGIARTSGDPTLTESGLLTGTPSYFAPELARGGEPTPAADVWALGATMYAAVEGRSPYDANANPVAVLHDIATRQPARPVHAGFLEPVLRRMLDPDPISRWSMEDAAHSLHRLAQENADDRTLAMTLAGGPAAAIDAPDRTEEQPPADQEGRAHGSPHRRRIWPAAVAVLAVLAALAGIGVATSRLVGSGGSSTGAAAGTKHAQTGHKSSRHGQQHSHRSSPTTTASTPPTSSSPQSPQATTAPPPSGSSLGSFLRHYYATAPQDTETGWTMLGPHERAVGRGSYDKFWSGIDSVQVSRIDASPAKNSADLTLTYHFSDGRVVVERQQLALIKSHSDRYLINDDTVLSSHTVHQ